MRNPAMVRVRPCQSMFVHIGHSSPLFCGFCAFSRQITSPGPSGSSLVTCHSPLPFRPLEEEKCQKPPYNGHKDLDVRFIICDTLPRVCQTLGSPRASGRVL